MATDYPNLKIDRVKNAAGETVEDYRHRVTGRSYGMNRERAHRFWAADKLSLTSPRERSRLPNTVGDALLT